METLLIFLTAVVVLTPAIVLHEFAHGWVAYRLGDPTAKNMGRLTLNPIKHIDPLGSIIIPGGLFLLHYFRITHRSAGLKRAHRMSGKSFTPADGGGNYFL